MCVDDPRFLFLRPIEVRNPPTIGVSHCDEREWKKHNEQLVMYSLSIVGDELSYYASEEYIAEGLKAGSAIS
ncbi:MAG: hypothetical protein ACO2O0_10915 [Desulfurococcales archaeon]|jgi:hypothetical protein